jgi:hypothetical protein
MEKINKYGGMMSRGKMNLVRSPPPHFIHKSYLTSKVESILVGFLFIKKPVLFYKTV